MCEDYTDAVYVQGYIRGSVEDASEDFLKYKSTIIGKKWSLTAFESIIESAHPLFKEALVAKGVIPKTDPSCSCHISPTS